LSAAKTQEASEYWNPPKIHENSVFIYQSKGLGNSVRYVRSVENITAAYVLFLCPHPLYYVAVGAVAYYMWFNVIKTTNFLHFSQSISMKIIISILFSTKIIQMINYYGMLNLVLYFLILPPPPPPPCIFIQF